MRPDAFVAVPNYREMQEHVAKVRRTLAELPLPTAQMNTISVVLMYTLIGISPAEIATATGMSVDQVKRLLSSEAYMRMRDDIVQTILDRDSADIKQMIAANARNAVNRIVGLIEDGEPTVALAAAKDIADRAGHRPADKLVIDGMQELRIRIVRDEKVPTIDITPGSVS